MALSRTCVRPPGSMPGGFLPRREWTGRWEMREEALLSDVARSPGAWGKGEHGCAGRSDGAELAFGISVEACKRITLCY